MKKLLLLTTLIFSIQVIVAQDHSFKPKWTVGDKKEIIIMTTEKSKEKGEKTTKKTNEQEIIVTVKNEDKESYTLEILQENIAMESLEELYQKVGNRLPEYKTLKLLYKVNKETGEAELLNWKEAKNFMAQSLEQISSLVEQESPEIAPMMEMAFAPIREAYADKEIMESSMDESIGFLLLPFQNDFKVGETVSATESMPSPFNPAEEVSVSSDVKLVSVTEKSAIFEHVMLPDPEQLVQMLKDMMMKMFEGFGEEMGDEFKTEIAKTFDSMKMDMDMLQTIHYNRTSTWVEKMEGNAVINVAAPGEGESQTIITTIAIVR